LDCHKFKEVNKKNRDRDEAPGSVLWMAPEVLLKEEIDKSLDVYSFALVFWEILTQEELFKTFDDRDIFTESIKKKVSVLISMASTQSSNKFSNNPGTTIPVNVPLFNYSWSI